MKRPGLDIANRPSVTLIAGRSGSGKSTFALRYLLNAEGVSCRFIFDPAEEYAHRLDIQPQRTPLEMEVGIRRGWCLFGTDLFPGEASAAFLSFCDVAWQFSAALPGRKLVLVDEVWKYCSPLAIPSELAMLVQEGRKIGLETVFLTQRPNRLNESILGEVTECVAFAMTGERGLLKVVQSCNVPEDEVAALAPGQYVSVSDRGGVARGRVF